MLENTIKHLIRRDSNEAELIYHDSNNSKKNINTFRWVCILNVCEECKPMNYRKMFVPVIRNVNSKIAVLFCGYIRNNKYTSHLPIINSEQCDVFIHTWDDYGHKNDARLINHVWLSNKISKIDPEALKKMYKPVSMLVENNRDMLDSFSIKDKISPLFLYAGQARDDASRYINSQLYSLHAGYKLICDYEVAHGFKYDAILRLRFDFNITNINWMGILTDVQSDNMFFPHAACNAHRHTGGGGGCMSCDSNTPHEKHTNDICDIWFYGKRDVASKACEMYLNGLAVMQENHEHNMALLKDDRVYSATKDNYVYITSTRDIENKYVAFYPERILRETLRGIACKSSKNISGKI